MGAIANVLRRLPEPDGTGFWIGSRIARMRRCGSCIDRDVLDYFQADGPGWQERINAAPRKAAKK
jgi:hypothetical protein